jgi:glycine/D-amino acid oxidase-like deaminating enzyme
MTRDAAAADLVVVGAGVMGAWTALQARRLGIGATLVDAYGAGHSRATSGDESRIIRASHGADQLYAAWSRRARDAWIAFGDEVGESFLTQAGALWFAHRPDGFESASEATLRGLGIPVERLTPGDVAQRWPQIATDDLAFATYEPEAGLLHARRAVAAIARRFVELDGRFELAWAEPGRTQGGRLIDVRLGDGRVIAADRFVFAAGPWLPRVFPELLGDLIRVTKQDVLFAGPNAGDDRFGADRLPVWIDYDAAFYGIPAIDGRGMKMAPDRYGPIFDPSHGERIVDPESARLARRYLGRRFPDLANAPFVETRVCQYETTPDTHFVIDRHPAFENVWLVGGGSGHGFKHGPVIGEAVLSRVAGNDAPAAEARFDLSHERIGRANMRTGADGMVAGWLDW